jgi:hypothetical protein
MVVCVLCCDSYNCSRVIIASVVGGSVLRYYLPVSAVSRLFLKVTTKGAKWRQRFLSL